MELTNEQKILIFLAIIIIVGYFVYNNCSAPKKVQEHLAGNIGSTKQDDDSASDDSTVSDDSDASSSVDASEASTASTASSVSSESAKVIMKVPTNDAVPAIRRGKNANTEATSKQVSYKEGKRGGSGDLDRFFMSGNVENAAENSEFGPADYVSDKLASYASNKTDEGLLPVEEKDWFEDVTPTKIKNRHLINIYRPVGVNTISTSLKNPSLDIRGAPANPKTVVSPFLNSSIEPDHNIKGLCV
jgi:hypothetical protein